MKYRVFSKKYVCFPLTFCDHILDIRNTQWHLQNVNYKYHHGLPKRGRKENIRKQLF